MSDVGKTPYAWFNPHPYEDPLIKDWMRVKPMHQRDDIIGGVAVKCMNASDEKSIYERYSRVV